LSKADAEGIRWRIEPSGLVLDERLHASFQRCARPPTGYFDRPPTSLGALPIAPDATGSLFLPMGEREAVWIGFTTVRAQSAVVVSVAVETHSHGTLDTISGRPWSEESFTSFTVRGHYAVNGIYRDDHSVWAFQSDLGSGAIPCCKAFIFHLPFGGMLPKAKHISKATQIQFTTHRDFFTLTSCQPPSPLDLNAGYRGWLLP